MIQAEIRQDTFSKDTYDPRCGPLGIISLLGLLQKVSVLSKDEDTIHALDILNEQLQTASAILFFEHSRRTTFGHLAHQVLLNTSETVHQILVPYAGYMHHTMVWGRWMFDQLNRTPGVIFSPVYRQDEFDQKRPKVKRIMQKSGLTSRDMYNQNIVYTDTAQRLLQQPGNIVFLSPYGGTQSNEVNPGIPNMLIELQRAGFPQPLILWAASVSRGENIPFLPDLFFRHDVHLMAEPTALSPLPEGLRGSNAGIKGYQRQLKEELGYLSETRFQELLSSRD